MTCPYCDSSEIESIPRDPVTSANYKCLKCGETWISIGPHEPLHPTYEGEVDRLVPDVDPKKKLESAYLLTFPPVTKPLVLWDGSFYDWWIRNLKPTKNVIIDNLGDL